MKANGGLPRRVRRLVRKHQGSAGLILLGRYPTNYLGMDYTAWRVVGTRIDGGEETGSVWRQRRGPVWVDVPPGVRQVEFRGMEGVLKTVQLRFGAQTVYYANFKPPLIRKFGRKTPEWSITRVRD